MLALTPPMGWNCWNTFGGDISEKLIRESADAFVSEGLRDAGYSYVVIDDLWEAEERDRDGRLATDADKFPRGMAPLAAHIHALGLGFGIYSCVGTYTCGRRPGSYANEELDARTFAEWGVDFLKYDYCYKPEGANGPELYRRMGQALRATGRPILYSACNWGREEPWKWAATCGAHMWRTTPDIVDTWESVRKILDAQNGLECYAGPGGWNDPDMLIVGVEGKGNVPTDGTCGEIEYRTHFSLWCLLAAPLMIGCDIRSMSPATKETLLNAEAIAVNQDPLGRQARRLGDSWLRFDQVWAKPLEDGAVAVGLLNVSKEPELVGVGWEPLGLHDRREAIVRDLWAHEEVGAFRGSYAQWVEPHGCALLRISPVR